MGEFASTTIYEGLALVLVPLWLVFMLVGKNENKVLASFDFIYVFFIFMNYRVPPRRYGFSIFAVIVLLLFVFLMMRRVVTHRRIFDREISSKPGIIAGLLFVGILIVSGILSVDPEFTVTRAVAFAMYFLFFFLCISNISRPILVHRLTRYLALWASVNFLFVVGQQIWGVTFSLYPEDLLTNSNIFLAGAMWRYFGFFYDVLLMGYFASVVSVYLLGSAWLAREGQKKALQLIPAGLAFVSAVFSGTRSAILGWLVGVSTYLVMGAGHLRQRIAIGLLAAVLIGLLYFFGSDVSLLARLPQTDQAANNRTAIWAQAIPVVLDSPYVGHGLGSYDDFTNKMELYQSNIYAVYPWSESVYVTLAVEAGILGGAAFLLFVFFYLSRVIWGKYTKKERKSAYLPAIAATAAWLTCGVAVSPFYDVRLLIVLFSLLALLGAHEVVDG